MSEVCSICKFPAGKYYNKVTGERRTTWFRKGREGYICNNCVREGRGIPVGKMSKKEKKEMKKKIRGY